MSSVLLFLDQSARSSFRFSMHFATYARMHEGKHATGAHLEGFTEQKQCVASADQLHAAGEGGADFEEHL